MKFNSSVVCLVFAAASGPLFAAAATTPAPPYKMDSASLGRLDALLTVCAKADAKNEAGYERYRKEMIVFGEGTPYEMHIDGSDSPEYKLARDQALEAAAKASTEEMMRACGRMIGADVADNQH